MGKMYVDMYDLKQRCCTCEHEEPTEEKDIIKCEVSKTHWGNRNVCSQWKEKNKDMKENNNG
jgi:hypothetical protein